MLPLSIFAECIYAVYKDMREGIRLAEHSHGKVVITLEEYRLAHNISKNKIVQGANVQRTQLQNYCNNKVARVDLDVLARICDFLNCELSDIMRYEKD